MTTTPVFWLSWFVVYSVMVTFIALLVSLVSKFVIIKSVHFGTIFLTCEIFGFTLIMFAFMVTALFSKRKAAGAFGGIITMLMALSYYLQVSLYSFLNSLKGPSVKDVRKTFSIFWTPSLFWTKLWYRIHATSLSI